MMNRQEYENKINELQIKNDGIKSQLEELKNVKIDDGEFPRLNDEYWFVDSDRGVVSRIWCKGIVGEYRKDFIRIFRTEEECERYLEIQQAFKGKSKEFKPNWKDLYQRKYRIYYNPIYERIEIGSKNMCQSTEDCFESEEVIEELIKRFGKEDIKKYYLGIEG